MAIGSMGKKNCASHEPIVGCLLKADGTTQSIVIHYEHGKSSITADTTYSDAGGVFFTPLATDTVTIGECCADCKKEYEVYVVRLSGDATGTSNAIIEADGFAAGDVGNTFTLGGASAFPEYVSYSAQWLGDSMQDAILDWNNISYLAGIGSGSATYYHAMLPALTDSSEQEFHTQEITLTANAGAYVEFRFKVLK